MRFDDGKSQAWLILSLCAVLTIAIVTLVAVALRGPAEDWAKGASRAFARGLAGGMRNRVRARPAPTPRPVPVSAVPASAIPVAVDVGSWITDDDYPPLAIREAREGVVHAALDVDDAGRPVRCRIVESSHVPILDAATCSALMRRARFNQGIAAGVVRHWPGRRVVWRLPR